MELTKALHAINLTKLVQMISIQYGLKNFREFLQYLSGQLRAPLDNDILIFPPHIGEGYFRLLTLPDDTEALIYDFKMKHDFRLERQKMPDLELYTFMLEDISHAGSLQVQIEDEDLILNDERRSAMYLTGSQYDVSYTVKANARIRGLRVLFSAGWLKGYACNEGNQNIVNEYLELKGSGAIAKKLDAESRDVLMQMVDGDRFSEPLLYFHSRILKQVEKFFLWMQQRRVHLSSEVGVSKKDIEKAIIVENLLLGDLTSTPPTIPELAKAVMMSESKLKKLFKQVYGHPPYVYFQKHRMDKARKMILTGEYAIKDVGFSLGYTNLSNFTIAFKKEHGVLPSELLN